MWMDQISARQCQIGIDAFLAGVLGSVDQLAFLTVSGLCRPTVVITVKGVDLRLAFPVRIQITSANLYLRAEPARLTADPYGAGWLFEGEPEEANRLERTVFRGAEAGSWMSEESRRLDRWLRQRVTPGSDSSFFPAGKGVNASWLEHLSREDVLSLFDEFFLTDDIHRR